MNANLRRQQLLTWDNLSDLNAEMSQRSGSIGWTFGFIFIFSILGYFLHFIWEVAQCAQFFRHLADNPSIASMFVAASGDVLMMYIVYIAVSLTQESMNWFQSEWTLKILIAISLTSILIAVLVELFALKAERWSYTPINPTIPWLEVSILPILQMLIINPIVFYFAKRTVSAFRRYAPTMETL